MNDECLETSRKRLALMQGRDEERRGQDILMRHLEALANDGLALPIGSCHELYGGGEVRSAASQAVQQDAKPKFQMLLPCIPRRDDWSDDDGVDCSAMIFGSKDESGIVSSNIGSADTLSVLAYQRYDGDVAGRRKYASL